MRPFPFLPFILLLPLVLLSSGCKSKSKPAAPAAPSVEVVPVIQKDVPLTIEWVATTDGFVNATIRPQVSGYLISQHYSEGDFVKKGQLLFEIDPRTFATIVEQCRGNLARQQAIWDTAKANLARIRPLAEKNAVSKKDLDDAIGDEQTAAAAVLSAQAELDQAQLNLAFTKITSPIDGIAGIAKTQIGDLVGPSQTEELTTVSTLDPIKVYIPLSEQEYLKAHTQTDGEPRKIKLQLVLADGTVFPSEGKFFSADRQIDPKTGTIRVVATFENPQNFLRPGQFAKVRATIKTISGALLVPQRAVSELQGSFQVAIVNKENRVEIRNVKTGERIGSLWLIEAGLNPADVVVAEGVQKVRNGMTVNPKNFNPASP